jgi:glycosyltransferase involved in cell wall biosynthesis
MKPKISILISVKDQLVLTKKCIHCLRDTLEGSIDFEVLIANDASTDGTANYLDSLPNGFGHFTVTKAVVLRRITIG